MPPRSGSEDYILASLLEMIAGLMAILLRKDDLLFLCLSLLETWQVELRPLQQ